MAKRITPSQAVAAGRARTALLVAAGLTLLLFLVPFGRFVAWPLMLLSTFVHEMGHGIAGVLVGGEFDSFRMWANGSGLARVGGYSGALARAAVSAGGLVGPAVVAAVFFTLGRRPRLARLSLDAFGAFCLVAMVVVVRNPFGWVFVGLLGALCLV
ncbi:MAG: M50 family peptidase, partial [Gemmatimonadetes bacterium]